MSCKRNLKCLQCPTLIARADTRTGLCLACYKQSRVPPPVMTRPMAEQVSLDRDTQRLRHELSSVKSRYQESLQVIGRLEQSLGTTTALKAGLETFTITPKLGHGASEATVIWTASDWHVEENVGSEIGGLNTYNLGIAKERATKFFQGGLRLTNLLAQDVKIPTIVLALLGDFISNDIHEEFPDVNEVTPMHAIVQAQNFLISGIEFVLKHSAYNLVLPCHSGNHARTTRTTRFAAENGHSLEYLMYLHLAAHFRHEPRVTFIIPEGMHSYMQVYDTTVRFQHGHAIKYGGGVGGIYIPVNKAISQWNKARHADLDVFGHFHQMRDGGNFICNGSLIGYNAFALSIKADYEKPKQALFLIDRDRGRTCTWPILTN